MGRVVALLAVLLLGAQERKNPGPGDPAPDLEYELAGGGKLRLSELRGKSVLIANHLVDDGPVSWLPDPFKRLKELQARYRDRLVVAVMPEYAHHVDQTPEVWKKTSEVVAELLDPGDLKVLVENRGERQNAGYGKGRLSLYYALNPEDRMGWWPMVLVDPAGRIAWSSQEPHTDNAEHIFYENDLAEAVMKLVDPEGHRKAAAEAPQDWVRQESPWGALEVEDFERYRDQLEWHLSPCWTGRPPTQTYKGELTLHPARTGYRSLSPVSWMRAGFLFGYPYYYGYRDPNMGAMFARHAFAGPPRTGTLVLHAAAFLRAAEFDYWAGKGKGLSFHLEGPGGQELGIHLGGDGRIAGRLRTEVKWNPENAWNRLSFHVDPVAGTEVFLGATRVGSAPQLKGLTAIRFLGGWACAVDDFVLVPKGVPAEELDRVVAWVDERAPERPHATPLEREREVARSGGGSRPKVLRVDWGSAEETRDSAGNAWKAERPWIRGSWGYLDGDRFAHREPLEGPAEPHHRTLRYSMNRLRFTVPNGSYTLRVHTARPFRGPHPRLDRTNHGSPMPGWERGLQMELHPDTPRREIWKVQTPYRAAAVFEKAGIRIADGLLDLRFNFDSLAHVAATELVQESVDDPAQAGIPDPPP